MVMDRKPGLPVLAPPVLGEPARPLARSVTPETPPPPPPPKEAVKKALPSKPKPVFPGPRAAGVDPSQSFAMSGPPASNTEGHDRAARAQRSPASNGVRDRQLPATPHGAQPSDGRGTVLTPIDTQTATSEAHVRSTVSPVANGTPARGAITPARTSPTVVQSGGFERNAVRTSSRPRAPRSSSSGPASATSMRSLDQAGPRVGNTLDGVPSPNHRPVFPATNTSASPTDALHPLSFTDFSARPVNGGSAAPSGSRSPSPREEAKRPSILDRPRPKTPTPQSNGEESLSQQHGSPRLLAPRPSAPAVLPSFAAAPVFPSRPTASRKSSSALDRPQNSTPERQNDTRHYQSLSGEGLTASGTTSRSTTPTVSPGPVFPSRSRPNVLDRPRPRTPEPRRVLEVNSSGSSPLGPTTSSSTVSPTDSTEGVSARDRFAGLPPPRRNTASPLTTSQDVASATLGVPRTSVLDRPRPKTPDATSWLRGASRTAAAPETTLPRPGDFATTSTTTLSSSKYGSLDSISPLSGSGISSATPASTASSHGASQGASIESGAKESPGTAGAPLLKLDFDFGSGFGTTGTMFGLSDFLQRDGDLTPTEPVSSQASSRIEPASSISPGASANALTTLPPRSSSLEGLAAPQSDLHTSGELVVESAPSAAAPEERKLETAGAQHPIVSGASFASTSDRVDSLTSLNSSTAETISDENSKSASIVSSSDASPDRPKRKRRKSLASLLSFRSTSQSVDDSHLQGSGASTAVAGNGSSTTSRVPQSDHSIDSGEHIQTDLPRPATSNLDTFALPQRKSQDLFRRRSQSRNASPDNSRNGARSANFQVISATTSRRPSRGASASISSVHTAETESSDLGRSSLDFGRQSSRSRNGPDRPDSRHQRVPSIPLGRRLVEKFARKDAHRPATSETATASWSAPVKDHSSEDAGSRPRLGRRRGSFSSLLGFKSGGASEVSSAAEPPTKKLLGMSLLAGRRSEDLLTSGRTMRSDPEERPYVEQSRHSFDMLAERLPRKSASSDDLLIITPRGLQRPTAAVHSLTESPDLFVDAMTDLQQDHSQDVPASPTVTATATDDSHDGEKGATVIATAKRISVLDIRDAKDTSEARDDAPEQQQNPSLEVQMPQVGEMPRMPTPPPKVVTKRRPRIISPVVPIWRQPQTTSAAAHAVEQTSMTSAWLNIEEALGSYQHLWREGRADRGAIISTLLLPFLRQEEQQGRSRLSRRLARRQREVLFGWVEVMTNELKRTQPVHRGALLEAVATILECHNLSIASLDGDEADQRRFRTAMVNILDFAIEKLNDKAVYANTLVFSGRVLALAFFRVDGVALKLIRALPPVRRQTLRRVLEESGADERNFPAIERERYPSHLLPLCLSDFGGYAVQVLTPRVASAQSQQFLVHDGNVRIDMSGNWLIRWTASDSDLPFSFYRAYFRQLASLLVPFELRAACASAPCLPATNVITAPGFLFVAASMLDKSDALVHRNLRSVTSISQNNGNFNSNDSANLSFGQKPKVLELAQRRVTTTMLDVVGGPRAAEATADAAARRYLFGTMLQVWIRATVKRTSMWDQRGVFLLLDLIESLIYTLAYPIAPMSDLNGNDEAAQKPDERSLDLLDVPFVFDFVRQILAEADNTVTIMRTIAFVYAHFEILTLRAEDRTELCERLILDEGLFQRLFLHWNSGCRGFFIRLLVWRVSRLGAVERESNPHYRVEPEVVSIFNLLNVRLEAVRKRHEQLEPAGNLTSDDAFFRPKRSTICSTRGVKEAPSASEDGADDASTVRDHVAIATSALEADSSKPERLAQPDPIADKSDQTAVSKMVSWLKGGRKQKGGRADRPKPLSLSTKNGSTAAQSWSSAPLPTKVETGDVQPPRDSTARSKDLSPPPTSADLVRSSSSASSSKSEKRKSRGSAFFAFEFENGVVSRADVDPKLLSPNATETGGPGSPSSAGSTSPTRPRDPERGAALSPRVSIRFSKRSSILPPAALDLLKSTGIEDVPPIPERFRRTVESGYAKRLHPYAVRGLRDYEDALDEWTDWVARLQEEEELAPSAFDIVPRLAVNWPLNSEEN